MSSDFLLSSDAGAKRWPCLRQEYTATESEPPAWSARAPAISLVAQATFNGGADSVVRVHRVAELLRLAFWRDAAGLP